jgi:hypothetical protein
MLFTTFFLFIFQKEFTILVVEMITKLSHHLRGLYFLAHGTGIIILKPFLNTVGVIKMSLVTSQRSDIVLTFDKWLQTNDALIHHHRSSLSIGLVK